MTTKTNTLHLGTDARGESVDVDLDRGALLVEGEYDDLQEIMESVLTELAPATDTAVIGVLVGTCVGHLNLASRLTHVITSASSAALNLASVLAEIETREASSTSTPKLALIFDDLDVLLNLGGKKAQQPMHQLVYAIIKRGSAVGVHTIAFTPRNDVPIDKLFAHRLTVRPLISQFANATLGSRAIAAASPEDYEPLTDRYQGFFYSDNEGELRRMSIQSVCRDCQHTAAVNYEHLRVELPWLEESIQDLLRRLTLGDYLKLVGVALLISLAFGTLLRLLNDAYGFLPDWMPF